MVRTSGFAGVYMAYQSFDQGAAVEMSRENAGRKPWTTPVVIVSHCVKDSRQRSTVLSDEGSPEYTHS